MRNCMPSSVACLKTEKYNTNKTNCALDIIIHNTKLQLTNYSLVLLATRRSSDLVSLVLLV